MTCNKCGDTIPAKRAAIGYCLCMPCGEHEAQARRHCTVPMNKSNYVYISPDSRALLAQLNPKRTT